MYLELEDTIKLLKALAPKLEYPDKDAVKMAITYLNTMNNQKKGA